MPSVLVADDHDLIREGIKAILRHQPEYRLVGEAVDGEETVDKVKQLKPDILLLDISMPKRSGLDLAEQVRRLSPATKIIIVSVHRSPLYIRKAFRSGVRGYLHKENATEDLVPALRRVAAGSTYVSSAVADYLTEQVGQQEPGEVPPGEAALTERETDILRLIVEGKTAKEIAGLLFISPRTVENHKQAILKKLELRKTSDLIKYAITHRIVDVEDP
ncbi:MAG: response regulator transcription factor [Candidatus Omnitrophica bacterium]|nr:response regulator transcription factor [Candidatus Omnitrophota bacterium]MBI3020819.1 response regulator transcription factor [Candidatus Omnitrophota bacterium]MBI3083587.1 response regulator transcription factor [Candidatus Omnitrophota bacterium]